MKIILISAVLAVCSISSGAMAGCISSPYHFFPAQNDTVVAHVMTTTGSCVHQWRAGGLMRTISASIVDLPHNGKLKQIGPFAFHYRANKGFKGSDTYSLRVCAAGTPGSGCSKVVYDMSVE